MKFFLNLLLRLEKDIQGSGEVDLCDPAPSPQLHGGKFVRVLFYFLLPPPVLCHAGLSPRVYQGRKGSHRFSTAPVQAVFQVTVTITGVLSGTWSLVFSKVEIIVSGKHQKLGPIGPADFSLGKKCLGVTCCAFSAGLSKETGVAACRGGAVASPPLGFCSIQATERGSQD